MGIEIYVQPMPERQKEGYLRLLETCGLRDEGDADIIALMTEGDALVACGALAGVENTVLYSLSECVSTDAALDILNEKGSMKAVLEVLTKRIHSYLQARAKGSARVGAVIFSYKNDLLLKTEYADEILKKALEG